MRRFFLAATALLAAGPARSEPAAIMPSHWPFPVYDIALPMENGTKLSGQHAMTAPAAAGGWSLAVSDEAIEVSLATEKAELVASAANTPDFKLGDVTDITLNGVQGFTADYFDPKRGTAATGYWVPNRRNRLVRIDVFFPEDTPKARATARSVVERIYFLKKDESGFETDPFRFETEFAQYDPSVIGGKGWKVSTYQYRSGSTPELIYILSRWETGADGKRWLHEGKVRMRNVTDENRAELTGPAVCGSQGGSGPMWRNIGCTPHNVTTEGRDWHGLLWTDTWDVFTHRGYMMRQVIGDRVLEIEIICSGTEDMRFACMDEAAMIAYKGIRLHPVPAAKPPASQ